jgi:DNA-binding MarR family transcriptional regulator
VSPAAGDGDRSAAARPGPGQVLFEFVRHWSRRWNGPAAAERGRDVLVTEAVHALRDRAEVTVNDVAAELGLDQSGASRMIAHAVERGYLTAHPAADARRRTIGVTPDGAALLDAAHRWQEATFTALTDDWTAAERAGFRRAMLRMLARSRQLTDPGAGRNPPPGPGRA